MGEHLVVKNDAYDHNGNKLCKCPTSHNVVCYAPVCILVNKPVDLASGRARIAKIGSIVP